MTDYSLEAIKGQDVLEDLIKSDLEFLNYLAFGGLRPSKCSLYGFVKLDIAKDLIDSLLSVSGIKTFVLINFKEDIKCFFSIDCIKSANIVHLNKISSLLNMDFEGRFLLKAKTGGFSILSDFNDYQVVLASDRKLELMHDAGISAEISSFEIQDLDQSQAGFINAMLRRAKAWNNAQSE